MSSKALMVIDRNSFSVALDISATERKEQALCQTALINKVNDQSSLEAATQALREVKTVLKEVEDSREAVKKPVLDLGRLIDATAKAFIDELKKEEWRVGQLVTNYTIEQEQIRRRIEAEERIKLREIEEAKQRELAKAKTVEQVKEIEERAAQEVQIAAPAAPPPARPAGLVAKTEWDFEVTDIHLLARMHPGLVKIEPARQAIKEVLNSGVRQIAGLRVFEKTTTHVRANAPLKAIDV